MKNRASILKQLAAVCVAFSLLGPIVAASADTNQVPPVDMSSRIARIEGSQFWGHGVILDSHHILTAAHVVDTDAQGYEFAIKNVMGFELGKAHILKIGNRRDVDLAVLEFSSVLKPLIGSLGPAPVCEKNEPAGSDVAVAFGSKTQWTHTSHDFVVYEKGTAYSNAVEAFLSHGVSGAGVYSVQLSCLAGIVSLQMGNSMDGATCISDDVNKIPKDAACLSRLGSVFVPASDLRKFLADIY